eukprot:s3310_g7.t2
MCFAPQRRSLCRHLYFQKRSDAEADCQWVFAVCLSRAEASQVDAQEPETCCSGVREWNSLDCWAELTGHGPETALCDITGRSTSQQFMFDDDGHIWHSSGECLGVNGEKLKKGKCATAEKWEIIDSFEPKWEIIDSFEPFETKAYKEAVVKYGLSADMPDH